MAGAGTAPLNFLIFVEFCLVDDEKHVVWWMIHFVSKGVRGGGGLNDVRCGLQTKMMLFGG